MHHSRILIVDDEEAIRDLIAFNLAKEGYRVALAASGEEALRQVRAERPGLVLLDLMLPDIDGLEVCRRLKRDAATQDVPVLMLTAKGEEADIVTGLELGADDYVTKPFSPRVLLARIRAVLRRKSADRIEEAATLRIHELAIDTARHEVRVADQPVELSPTEFRVLGILARRPGWVLTRAQIAAAIHGEEWVVTDRSVDVQIVGLRRKLGSAAAYIETIRGVGYRLKE
jgi:two-component system alkaline phosphatase synthesis response regulator PhoP